MNRPIAKVELPQPRKAGRSADLPDLTIACCVEFGRLEEQTVLMVRSLRTFGGAFAQVPVIAVIGRSGAPLRKRTRDELATLGVRVVRARHEANPAPWLNYANKIAAVVTADAIAETGQVAWFDSDMFVLQEPKGISLAKDEDIAAQCHHLPPAVIEGEHTHEAYWSKVCALFGLDFDGVPWTKAAKQFPRQRLNFTSGLFTWKRGSGFAQNYLEGVKTLLDARLAQASGEFFTFDQVVLTPLIVGEELRWKALDVEDHSIVLGPFLAADAREVPDFNKARILHYSNSFAPPYRQLMNDRLARQVPDFAKWLKTQERNLDLGPAPTLSRAYARMLKAVRALRYRAYARSTTVVA